VRWALTWKGKFIDAQTTWEERAMTPAKPLGENVQPMPVRMPLAKLGSASDAWPETYGVGAGYAFKGYRMAKDGVPTFLYEVQGVKVEDEMRPSADGKVWKHTVTVRVEKGREDEIRNWYFLGLGKDAKPMPLAWKDGAVIITEEVQP